MKSPVAHALPAAAEQQITGSVCTARRIRRRRWQKAREFVDDLTA